MDIEIQTQHVEMQPEWRAFAGRQLHLPIEDN